MGATEIIFIFLIYLLFFGAKGIPSLAKTMGKAMYQFREARNDIQREILDSAKDITSSAKEVRREVENAAKLAERQAKKAQNMMEGKTPEKPKAEKQPEIAPAPEVNPLTPSDSISSSGMDSGASFAKNQSESDEEDLSTDSKT